MSLVAKSAFISKGRWSAAQRRCWEAGHLGGQRWFWCQELKRAFAQGWLIPVTSSEPYRRGCSPKPCVHEGGWFVFPLGWANTTTMCWVSVEWDPMDVYVCIFECANRHFDIKSEPLMTVCGNIYLKVLFSANTGHVKAEYWKNS